MFDVQGKPTTIPFDLVNGSSPLIIGIDIEKYGNTHNRGEKKYIAFRRPQDKSKIIFFTYIAKDGNGDERSWLDLVPHTNSSVKSLMGNIKTRPEINIVKKVH